jgi:hypothetical protein
VNVKRQVYVKRQVLVSLEDKCIELFVIV